MIAGNIFGFDQSALPSLIPSQSTRKVCRSNLGQIAHQCIHCIRKAIPSGIKGANVICCTWHHQDAIVDAVLPSL